MWNGIIAGLAAGAAIGMRVGRVPAGVGAAVALAATSAAVDTTGGHLVGSVRSLPIEHRLIRQLPNEALVLLRLSLLPSLGLNLD